MHNKPMAISRGRARQISGTALFLRGSQQQTARSWRAISAAATRAAADGGDCLLHHDGGKQRGCTVDRKRPEQRSANQIKVRRRNAAPSVRKVAEPIFAQRICSRVCYSADRQTYCEPNNLVLVIVGDESARYGPFSERIFSAKFPVCQRPTSIFSRWNVIVELPSFSVFRHRQQIIILSEASRVWLPSARQSLYETLPQYSLKPTGRDQTYPEIRWQAYF